MGGLRGLKRGKHLIIVGGPGTGKTTLTNALSNSLRRYGLKTYVIRDWAREVIIEQKALRGRLLPWIDRVGFEREVVRRHVKEYEALYVKGLGVRYDIVLEDGSPFIAPAYMVVDGRGIDEWVAERLRKWSWIVDYAVITTPLPTYGTDNARWEGREYALRVHEEIRDEIKREFQGRVIELRSDELTGRVKEVINHLKPVIRELLRHGVRA